MRVGLSETAVNGKNRLLPVGQIHGANGILFRGRGRSLIRARVIGHGPFKFVVGCTDLGLVAPVVGP